MVNHYFFSPSDLVKRMSECTNVCDRRCDEYTTYETAVTSAKFGYSSNNRQAMEFMKSVLGLNVNRSKEFLENAVSVKIFYTSNEIISIETGEKMPILQFISNTGGQLGKNCKRLFIIYTRCPQRRCSNFNKSTTHQQKKRSVS